MMSGVSAYGDGDHHDPEESLKQLKSKPDEVDKKGLEHAAVKEGVTGLTTATSDMPMIFAILEDDQIIQRRLLIDGEGREGGDDRTLKKLVEIYLNIVEEEQEKIMVKDMYEGLKTFLKRCEGLRVLANKSLHAIDINLKANKYQQIVTQSLEKEMVELKNLVKSHRQKAQEIKIKQKQNVELLAAMELLKGQEERSTLEMSLKKLTQEMDTLSEKDKGLAGMIDRQKQYLDLLCDLTKRLSDDNPEIVEKAVDDTEKRVLSDVSMELE